MASITPISGSDFSTFDGGQYTSMVGSASSFNGEIFYVCINNTGVVQSTDNGASWNTVYNNPGLTSIACSSDGSIVYAVLLGVGLFKSIDTGVSWNQVTFLPDNTLPGGSANPESPTGGEFPGYTLDNIYQIASDSTGDKLIMTTNAAASIYQSTDGGLSWSFLYAPPGYSTNPNAPTYVTSNADGSILYAALNTNTISKTIIVSKDSGVTWSSIYMSNIT